MDFIYCRGGDKTAPEIARAAGMTYGVRYDYTAYDSVYMLDAGLAPRWARYKKRVRKLRPTFALVPDFELYRDEILMQLYIDDLRELGVPRIGVTPKFWGALAMIPNDDDIIICISIPTRYSGYLPADEELRAGANYHLLGGDIRAQLAEARRIHGHGGRVVSMDGNKLAMKAAHGQVWDGRRWAKANDSTENNALTSAQNIMRTIAAVGHTST